MFPLGWIDGDVQAGLREDHVAHEVFVREFVVDALRAVGRAARGLNDRVGVPGQHGHRER